MTNNTIVIIDYYKINVKALESISTQKFIKYIIYITIYGDI